MAHNFHDDLLERWRGHIRRGDFDSAWEISDAVLRARAGMSCSHLPLHLQYFWDGTPLDGKRVLVRCYNGLGDTIQFIRYAPMVRRIASQVIVQAPPSLIPILRTMRGIDRILPTSDSPPEAEYDAEVEVMELQHVFRTTLATIPAEVPYLHAEPLPLPLERDGRLAVGIVWKAGDWDARRSIPFEMLAPLSKLPNVTWYIFQHGPGLQERSGDFGILLAYDDILEEARLMRSLDLLISVDSMPVHFAGALGIRVWTLLHAEAPCRWFEGRDDSPWYPTMRLFRQERLGEWEPVIARVARELARL